METCNKIPGVLKLDFNEKTNLLPSSDIDIGFKAQQALRLVKTARQKQIFAFKLETRSFLKEVVKKIVEKSPLKSKLLRNLSWLNPEV